MGSLSSGSLNVVGPLQWWVPQSCGAPKVVGLLNWGAPEHCPMLLGSVCVWGLLKLNEISFPDFYFTFKRAPWHLRARGHGPAGPYVNPTLYHIIVQFTTI